MASIAKLDISTLAETIMRQTLENDTNFKQMMNLFQVHFLYLHISIDRTYPKGRHYYKKH